MDTGTRVTIIATGECGTFQQLNHFCGGTNIVVKVDGERRYRKIALMPGKAVSDYLFAPANPAAHAFLIVHGYEHDYRCTFEDDGDAENGPHLTGGEWDEYTSATDRVFINYYDGAADFELRDLLAEEADTAYHSAMGGI